MELRLTQNNSLGKLLKAFFIIIALFFTGNCAFSQIIDETFEEPEWQAGLTTSGQVVITATSVSSTVTYGSIQGANITSLTRLNTTPNSGTWFYSKTGSNSGTKLDKQHSYSNSIKLSSSGYVITPVTKSAFVSVTFWAALANPISVGINTDPAAGQPAWSTGGAASIPGGYSYASQTFGSAAGNSSMTLYNYTGTFSAPARIGFFNTGGSSIYIDDITVMQPTGTPPVVTTTGVVCGKNTGQVSGTITAGTMPLQSSGFIWSTNPLPMDVTLTTKTQNQPAVTGASSYTVPNLIPSTPYYYRAYVIDLAGNVYYGVVLPCSTLAPTKPTVVTTTPTGTNPYEAVSGGNITDSGGVTISSKGIVWSLAPNPTIKGSGVTRTNEGAYGVPNPYTSQVRILQPNTTYHVRAYAINSIDTAYGSDIPYTTSAAAPALIADPLTLNYGNVSFGSTAPILTYTLTGHNLSPATGTISLSIPAGYTAATAIGGPYSASFTIPYSGGALPKTTVYVKLSTANYGYYAGNISHTGGGVPATSADNVFLSGMVIQDPAVTTNVGTDFWAGFGYQEKMSKKAGDTDEAHLSFYITVPDGSQNAIVNVQLPGVPGYEHWHDNLVVTPGAAVEVGGWHPENPPTGDPNNALNPSAMPDSRLYYTGVSSRAFHIYSTNGVPISVWMHSFTDKNSAAGAMLFPTNTWNSAYTVEAYGGTSNNSDPNSFFFVVAKEDNTKVWFTPSKDILDSTTAAIFSENNDMSPNIKYLANGTEYGPITLNKGQIFNAMGAISGSLGLDLTGSKVRTTCDKKIAVFGGNGRCLINAAGCSASSGSDHMLQQMFPSVAWGKKYLTVPTKTMEYNLFRINVNDPTTIVKVNGTPLATSSLINGLYYEVSTSQLLMIEADKPILVTQLIVSATCAQGFGSKGSGDPEMIILSPVEQAIKNTTVYSAGTKLRPTGISGHYLNVVIRKGGEASFRLDGQAVADTGISQTSVTSGSTAAYNYAGVKVPMTTAFKPHPSDPTNYSYAKFRVDSLKTHTLVSDSAFNAIAYGMGDGESYGYNAGTQLKDLSQFQLVNNAYNTGQTTACKNSPFYLRIAIPYAPGQLNSLEWQFFGDANLSPNKDTALLFGTTNYDSTFISNNTTYYVYGLPISYTYSSTGALSYKVVANTKTADGCNGIKEWNNFLTIGNGLIPDFSATTGTCGDLKVLFSDKSVPDPGSSIVKWNWDFGDLSTLADTAHSKDTAWTYPATLQYNVTLRAINTFGCYQELTKTIDLSGGLTTSYTISPATTVCTGTTVTFTDNSTSSGLNGTIVEWDWDFGEGPVVVSTTQAAQTHTYNTVGSYPSSLKVKTSLGCLYTIFQQTITVAPIPAVNSASTTTVCTGVPLNYQITATVPSTTFSWSRAAVAGISNPAVSNQPFDVITEALDNTTNAPINVTYIITPKLATCTGSNFNLVVTVNPQTSITSATTASICSGVALNYNITSNVTGTTFSWSRAAVGGISNPAVSGQTANPIPEALVNTTTSAVHVIYVITPTANGCPGAPFNLDVTVKPSPDVTSSARASVCSGTPFTYTITSGVTGATFSWSRAAVTGISNTAALGQTANPINETLTNTTNSDILVTYVINSTASTCTAAPFNLVVTVHPTATVTSAATGSVCSGSPFTYNITSGVAGATFTWSRAAVANITNPAVSGQTTNPISETLVNTTTAPINVTYVITPSGNGCPGTPFNYVVTVNPTPSITSANAGAVCSGNPFVYTITSTVTTAGISYSWNRAAVSGINNNTSGSGASASINEVLTNSTLSPITVVYQVTVSFGGCTSSVFNLSVTVNPAPTINSQAADHVCSGTALNYTITSTITVPGVTYSWSRAAVANISNPTVSAQTSNPITETLVNTGNVPVDVTYIINSNYQSCPGAPFKYVVTVYPKATVTSAATKTVCSGLPLNYSINSNVAGATFTWSRAAVTGISNAAASGTVNPIDEVLINTTNSPLHVTYIISPTANGCGGPSFNLDVTVNPTPVVNSSATATVCNATPLNYTITSGVTGASFTWSRAGVTGISNGAVASQFANPIMEALNNTTTSDVQVTYIISSSASTCTAPDFNLVVTVHPTPTVTSAATSSVCSGSAFSYNITSGVTGATYTWSRAAVTGIVNATVTGQTSNPIAETLVNSTTAPINVIYTINPAANGCNGPSFNLTVAVNPTPTITSASTNRICSNTLLSYNITSNVAGAIYSWSRAAVAGISNLAATGTASISETLVNTSTSAVVVTYAITGSFGGCTSAIFNYIVTVDPTPHISSAATATICSGASVNYNITSDVAGASYTWTRSTVAGIAEPGSSGTTTPINETLTNTTKGPVVATYSLTATANGCTSSPSFRLDVTVNPAAVVTSKATDQACSGSVYNYVATSNVTGATFVWSRAAVAGISNAAATGTGNVSEILVNTYLSPLTVTYVITPTANGCAGSSFNLDVTVNPLPNVSSLAAVSVCDNTPLNYNIQSGVIGATFSWSRAAVPNIGNSAATGTANPISEQLDNTGNSPVAVTYVITSTANSCAAPAFNLVVTVNPTASITSKATDSVCSSNPLNYKITSNVSGVNYIWSRASVAGISNPPVTNQPDQAITEKLINTTSSAIKVDYIITASINGCAGPSFTYTATVNPNPQVDIAFVKDSECSTDSVRFTGLVSSDVVKYNWNYSDGSKGDTIQNPLHLFPRGGSYAVHFTGTTAVPCSVTKDTIVNLAATLNVPLVTFTGTTNTITFSWPSIPGAITYEVSLDNGVTWVKPNGSDGLSYIIDGLVPEERRSVMVRANGIFDCQRSMSGLIVGQAYYPEVGVFVPNTIAPDCNCTNNRLRVKGNYLQNVSIKVFNQWGQLLYSYSGTDIDNNGWDGTYKNTPQPSGVYAYAAIVVLRDGTVVKKSGLFNIIR